MSNKIFLLFSFVLVLGSTAGMYWFTSQYNADIELSSEESYQKQAITPPTKKHTRSIVESKSIENIPEESTPSSTFTIDHLDSLSLLNLWFSLDESTEIKNIQLDERIEIAARLGVSPEYLPLLKKGQWLELPSSGANRYMMKLTDHRRMGKSKYEIHGEFEANGRLYFSNFSIVKANIYGLIQTPDGEFNLRMSDGKGYLYEADQLEKYHGNDTDAPDVITDIPGFLD